MKCGSEEAEFADRVRQRRKCVAGVLTQQGQSQLFQNAVVKE